MNSLTIGQVASETGVHKETIRYYQGLGLVAEPPRAQGSIRRYGPETVARLFFIKRAQQLGFSLQEIGRLLSLEEAQECGKARQIAVEKLDLVRARIADLNRMRRLLESLVTACGSGRSRQSCPIIASLAGDASVPAPAARDG